MARPPASDHAALPSFFPPLICIWCSKKRCTKSRVTVDVDNVALDCGLKARSMENGALGNPALWASVTTGLAAGGRDAAPSRRQGRKHRPIAVDLRYVSR